MRVLVVTGLTHYGCGGVQRETTRLVESLITRGVEVGVMSDVFSTSGIFRHFPIPYPPDANTGQILRAVEQEFQPDLIHVVGGGVRMLEAIHRNAPIAPWVITIHNIPPLERGSTRFSGRNGLYYAVRNMASIPNNLAWRIFLARAGFVHAICHSEIVAKRVAACGCPAKKIVEIPLGADLDLTENGTHAAASGAFPPGAYPRILSIGGLIHHKGFHDFLPVTSKLLADWPQLHYCVIGETRGCPQYKAHLLDLAERVGMKGHFSLLSNASEEKRQSALASADLYVQPSHEEGFCLSFLEAAMTVPRVIGTETGAIASIAAGCEGIRVVRTKSPSGLEAASRELLAQSFKRPVESKRQQILLDRFSWGTHARLHLNLYGAIANGVRA